jgi:hypothetical protein
MKEDKQKVYIFLSIGITLFLCIAFILLSVFYSSFFGSKYELKNFEIANITTQTVDLYWKGYSEDDGFKVLYKDSQSTGAYKEILSQNIYTDHLYTQGYLYNVKLENLNPGTEYLIEVWDDDIKLIEDRVSTLNIQEEIELPNPLSGESLLGTWIKVSDDFNTYITRTDFQGRWSLDANLINDEYSTEIYASTIVPKENLISSLLNKEIFAAQFVNCDEITYSNIDSQVKLYAEHVQNALELNSGSSDGGPKYLKCYQDVYCEAEKNGVNPRWALTNWMHESNASDYDNPNVAGADFGVRCCGVPLHNLQAQLGFFLSLTHDPCECNGSCSKEEYYCCWANNYLYGNNSKTCSDSTQAYLTSLLFYYYLTVNKVLPQDFDRMLAGLPSSIKSSAVNVSCGSTDSVEEYRKIVDPNPPEPNPPEPTEGICCALKITGKEEFRGDYEDSNKTCEQIWKVGREVYGGKIEYSVEIGGLNRASCEKWWEGVCCKDSGEYEWIPLRNCNSKATEYGTYKTCIEANEEPGEPEEEMVCCLDGDEYKWIEKSFCNNIVSKYQTESACLEANEEPGEPEEEMVCCLDGDEYEWIEKSSCSNVVDEYQTESACLEANEEPEEEMVCCLDGDEYEWIEKSSCSNVVDEYQTESSCLEANGREVTLELDLEKGYNFVAINASDSSNPLTASKLFYNPAVILVAAFRDGVWDRIMYREDGDVKGANFDLEKGNAYLITATTDFEMKYSGRTFTEFSWDGMKGWQFVPAKALDPYSDTKSVVLNFDTVDITQVGLWNKDLGKFDYYLFDIFGNEHGESVRLDDDLGVFVKID